jgi:hypothetical protein
MRFYLESLDIVGWLYIIIGDYNGWIDVGGVVGLTAR